MSFLNALLLVLDLEAHKGVEVFEVQLHDTKGLLASFVLARRRRGVVHVHEAAVGLAHLVVDDERPVGVHVHIRIVLPLLGRRGLGVPDILVSQVNRLVLFIRCNEVIPQRVRTQPRSQHSLIDPGCIVRHVIHIPLDVLDSRLVVKLAEELLDLAALDGFDLFGVHVHFALVVEFSD